VPSPSKIQYCAHVCTIPTAAQHLLQRMHIDPRLAYLLGPGSQAFDLITQEAAQQLGQPVDDVRRDAAVNLQYQAWPSNGSAA